MRRNKFNAVPTVVDGIRFASKAEAKRYGELKLLERAKHIVGLIAHPRFPLFCNGADVGHYTGDFRYSENGVSVVEDVKGTITEAAALRIKLFQALYPSIRFRIIGGKTRALGAAASKPRQTRSAASAAKRA